MGIKDSEFSGGAIAPTALAEVVRFQLLSARQGAMVLFCTPLDPTGPRDKHIYTMVVGTQWVAVWKNGEKIIDEEDVLDPLNPNENECSIISFAKCLEGFDSRVYHLACGLSRVVQENPHQEFVRGWFERKLKSLLVGD